MNIIQKFYGWFRHAISAPGQKGEQSSGIWPEAIRRCVLAYLGDHLQGRVFEFGCGEGLLLRGIKKANPCVELWGLDKNQFVLDRARLLLEKEGIRDVHLVEGGEGRLPLESSYFDRVICVNVFLNLKDLETVRAVVKEFSRILRQNGTLIVEFRNAANPFLFVKYGLAKYYDATIKEQGLCLNTFAVRQIEGLLKESGLSVTCKKFLGFPYNGLAPIVVLNAVKR